MHVRTRASGGNARAKQQACTVLVTVRAALGEILIHYEASGSALASLNIVPGA